MSVEIQQRYAGIPTLYLPSGQAIDIIHPTTIGRADDNDVVLSDRSVSRHHCLITPENGTLILRDQGSSGGTVVNDNPPLSEPYSLQDGDRIRLGAVELEVRWWDTEATRVQAPLVSEPDEETAIAIGSPVSPDPVAPATAAAAPVPVAEEQPSDQPVLAPLAKVPLYLRRGPDAPQVFDWDPALPFTLGRSPESTLAVADDLLSRHHLVITCRGETAVLADMGSANGTFLDGAPVTGSQELRPGDEIAAGPVELVFDPLPYQPGTATLAFRGGRYEGRELPLDAGTLTVGQREDCDVVVSDASVAPLHARIERFFSDYWVFPADPDRPIWVNGQPVTGPTLLTGDSSMRFGDVTAILRQRAAAAPRRQRAARRAGVALREVVPFSGLDEPSLAAVLQAGGEVSFDENDFLLQPSGERHSSKAGALYVILEGEAEVQAAINDDWDQITRVTTVGPGEFVGERVLAYDQPYPYRVQSRSAVRAFRLLPKDYERLRSAMPSLGGFMKDKVARQGMVKYLRRIPLLANLPEESLAALAARIKLQKVPAGTVIVRAGETMSTLFLVAAGSFRVDSIERGEVQTLTVFHEGEFVGEQVAAEEKSPYTVVAQRASEVFTLSRDEFLALKLEHPEALNFGPSGAPPSVILERTPPFDTLPPELVTQAAFELRVKAFRAGEEIISQDDPNSSAFYIVAAGQAEVLFRASDGTQRTLAQIKPGECFGESALITNSPRNATVRAVEDCQLLALYRREFFDIVGRSPVQFGGFLGHTFSSRFRPRHIRNVETFEEHVRGSVNYILRNVDRNTYVSLSSQGYFIWGLLDGDHTMNDIAAAYYQQYKSLAMGTMFNTITQLQQLGFLDVGMDELMQRMRGSFRMTAFQRLAFGASRVMQFQKQMRHADGFFRAAYNGFLKVFYTWPVLALLVLVNIAGVIEFLRIQVSGSGTKGVKLTGLTLLVFYLVNVLAVVAHEMGHGVTMIHFGRKVHGAGFGIKYLMPIVFVNTTDSWLATKWQRLAVDGAGLIVSITISSVASLLLLTTDNIVLKTIFVGLAYVGYLGLFTNLAPMLPTDGYNCLMDLLAIPDLRAKSFRYLFTGDLFRDIFRRRKMTYESKAFAIFSIITVAFLIFFGVQIALAVSLLLAPHLHGHIPSGAILAIKIALPVFVLLMFSLTMLQEAGLVARKPSR